MIETEFYLLVPLLLVPIGYSIKGYWQFIRELIGASKTPEEFHKPEYLLPLFFYAIAAVIWPPMFVFSYFVLPGIFVLSEKTRAHIHREKWLIWSHLSYGIAFLIYAIAFTQTIEWLVAVFVINLVSGIILALKSDYRRYAANK